MRTRSFVLAGLVVTLLVAGGLSYYASSHPDGLEYVAEQVGFGDSEEDSATADSPLADYRVKGVENDALSGALAGVVGSLIVLALASGLVYVVRRRASTDRMDEGSDTDPDEQPDEQPSVDRMNAHDAHEHAEADESPAHEQPRRGS